MWRPSVLSLFSCRLAGDQRARRDARQDSDADDDDDDKKVWNKDLIASVQFNNISCC